VYENKFFGLLFVGCAALTRLATVPCILRQLALTANNIFSHSFYTIIGANKMQQLFSGTPSGRWFRPIIELACTKYLNRHPARASPAKARVAQEPGAG
jgi:hypothetical protein